MSVTPVAPVDAVPLLDRTSLTQPPVTQPQFSGAVSFGQMLENGIDKINDKLLNADNMVRAFTLDDSIPVHQVTFALDQAKSAMELALQVRARLLDGYQQLMNMQI